MAGRGGKARTAIRLDGSCHCGKVRFRVMSETPYPFMYCYCSICRKTAGPFACNIMGKRDTLRVTGSRWLRMFHAVMRNPRQRATRSSAARWFCGECSTQLYLLDDRWPDGVWPLATAIDTPLPIAPSNVHLMLRDKPVWVPVPGRGPRYPKYPELSIADWHAHHGLDGGTAREDAKPRRASRRRPTGTVRRRTGTARRRRVARRSQTQ